MDIQTAIDRLDSEWDRVETGGFFERLHFGVFDEDGFERVWRILNAIEIPEPEDGDVFNRRFVEVVWFMPTFMHWQAEAWRMDGKDTKRLDEATSAIEQRLTMILGLP